MIKIFKLIPLFAIFTMSACNIALSDATNPYTNSPKGGFTHSNFYNTQGPVFYKGFAGQGKAKTVEKFKEEVKKFASLQNATWYKLSEIEVQSMRKNYYKYSQEQQAQIDKNLSPEQINSETTWYVKAYLIIGNDPAPDGAFSVK